MRIARTLLLPRVAAILIAALAVTGCAATDPGAAVTGAGDTPGASIAASPDTCHGDAKVPAASEPLASLTLTGDVRAATGGSTACLVDHTIDSVDDATAPSLPVSVTDAEGRTVEVTDVSRIIAVDISGTIAATVFALGLGDNMVGRDSSTGFAGSEQLPVVTASGHTLNAEAILELSPTVVLTDTTIGPKEVREQLRAAGIAVVVISSERRLDTADELVGEIATALGVPTRGDALATRLTADIADAVAEIAAVAPSAPDERARMLFLYVRGSANVYYIFGADSGADSLIDAVGGIDVASEIGWQGMRPMTAEALVSAQPDVLVMMTDGLASVGGIDGLIERIPALAQTPAGQHRRVIDMADSAILSFGPRSADIIRALARALYAPADSPTSPPETGDAAP